MGDVNHHNFDETSTFESIVGRCETSFLPTANLYCQCHALVCGVWMNDSKLACAWTDRVERFSVDEVFGGNDVDVEFDVVFW